MNSDSTEQTRVLVQQFIRSLSERDLEHVIQFFGNKVDWLVPGNQAVAPWLGKRKNKQEVMEFFELLWKNTEPVSAHIAHILAEDEFAVVTGTFSTRMLKTGSIVDSLFSIHITVEDGLIVRYRLQEDSYAVLVALVE